MTKAEELFKRIVKEGNFQAAMLLAIEKNGDILVETDGDYQYHKEVMSRWAQDCISENISIVPFRTVFGCGNNGVPHRLSNIELEQMDYVELEWVNYIETGSPLIKLS